MKSASRPLRVLVADDDAQILDAYRRVFDDLTNSSSAGASELDSLSAELFGEPAAGSAVCDPCSLDEVVYCRQGEQAIQEVDRGLRSGRPYAVVFLDMRMPPGIDGLETARRIRGLDPYINIVVVTGYSDHKPAEISNLVGQPERLFYLVKPFDANELQQMATALAKRWLSDLGIAEELALRVAELERMNAALKASEAHAHEVARIDVLTGLANRIGLRERFAQEAAAAQGNERELSVLYLDLDRFKEVNDSLGHPAGDELIREFASRVQRATGEDGFAARLGGDEFAVICSDRRRVGALVGRLLEACRKTYTLLGRTVGTSVSIGIAHCDAANADLSETMRRADIALYSAKGAGRGVAREFDAAMDRDILGTQLLMLELAQALARDELMLHYQPMVSGSGDRIYGVEALLRWNHPSRGMLPPADFIGIAEKTELIGELGAWVIRRAFTDSQAWPDLVTAINLSPAQLKAPGFVERVIGLATELKVNPVMIEFEVTETLLIEDIATAASQIRALKDAGFLIALDDFGSGYAGLSYLSRIQFDRLKIDRSFVQDIGNKAGADGVIQSIIDLGQAMGLAVTAEGVESPEQHELLQAAGCRQMQGFLFHRPLSRDDILAMRTREAAKRQTS